MLLARQRVGRGGGNGGTAGEAARELAVAARRDIADTAAHAQRWLLGAHSAAPAVGEQDALDCGGAGSDARPPR